MFFYDHCGQTDDDDYDDKDNDDYDDKDDEDKVEDVDDIDDDDYRADDFVEQERQSHVSTTHWSGEFTLYH